MIVIRHNIYLRLYISELLIQNYEIKINLLFIFPYLYYIII
jgi:hypothetical protein